MSSITGNISEEEMYCSSCGKVVLKKIEICPHCGVRIRQGESEFYARGSDVSDCNRSLVLVFCLFLGFWGVHRFYVGRWVTGVVWAVTFGIIGLGVLVDAILILLGRFRDIDGDRVVRW